MTRDARIWNILFAIGSVVTVALAPVTTPAEYGLTLAQLNWVKLVAALLIAAGKLGNSPLGPAPKEARSALREEV